MTLSSASTVLVDLNRLTTSERQRRDDIKYLLDSDVIFVTSAGNDAKEKDRDGTYGKILTERQPYSRDQTTP